MPVTSEETIASALTELRQGRRAEGVRLLSGRYTSDPGDLSLAHALAVMTLWGRVETPGAASTDRDDALCLGVWASLLADPRFWSRFADDATERYRTPVDGGTLRRARERFRTWLGEQVLETSGVAAEVRLAQEMRAADITAARGGVLPEGAVVPIPCGPLLAAELGQEVAVARIARRLDRSPDEDTRRTALLFCRIGAAVVLLDRGRVAEAVTAVGDLRCRTCALDPPDRSTIAVCRPGCPDFERANPAYRGQDGRARFALDAGRFLVEARLQQVTLAIEGSTPEATAAREGLGRVQALAGELGLDGELGDYLLGPFRARVDALRRDGARDEAIALLDAVPDVSGAPDDDTAVGELRRLLASMLAARGVARVNGGDSSGLADLRRAGTLHPGSRYVARNLAVGLANTAYTLTGATDDPSLTAAAEWLVEAGEACLAYLRSDPGDAELADTRRGIEDSLAALQNSRAVRAHDAGRAAEAVELIEHACRLRPNEARFRENRTELRRAARTPGLADATRRRDLDAMERILTTALRAHPRDGDLERRLREVHQAQADTLNARAVAAADPSDPARLDLALAESLLTKAAAKDPSSATIQENRRQVALMRRHLGGTGGTPRPEPAPASRPQARPQPQAQPQARPKVQPQARPQAQPRRRAPEPPPKQPWTRRLGAWAKGWFG